MDQIDDLFAIAAEKNANGTLTIGETIQFGYYRLLDGPHAGRVVIKTTTRIDDQPVLYFADTMTWIYTENLRTTRCESTSPTFPEPHHQIMTTLAAITHYLEETLQTPITLHTVTTPQSFSYQYAQINNTIFGIGDHHEDTYLTILHDYLYWHHTPDQAAACITNPRLRHIITTRDPTTTRNYTTIDLLDPHSIDQITQTLRSLKSDPPTT